MTPRHVFVLARWASKPYRYAGVSRPEGGLCLPGGQVNDGETGADAVIRESREDGWEILLTTNKPIHSQLVAGKLVAWYVGIAVKQRDPRRKGDQKGTYTVGLKPSQIVSVGVISDKLGIPL